MKGLLERVHLKVRKQPQIDIPYYDTVVEVKQDYGTGRWYWLILIITIVIIGVSYFSQQGFSPLTVVAFGIGLYGGLFAPLYFIRASAAMLSQSNYHRVANCIKFLRKRDYKPDQLKKIKLMAETDKDNISHNTALANVYWPIVVALGTAAFSLPRNYQIPIIFIIVGVAVVTVPLVSFLVQTERADVDFAIIQAVNNELRVEE